jgi:hypothetical protein
LNTLAHGLAVLLLGVSLGSAADVFDGGHVKARLNAIDYPSDNLLGELGDNPAFDQGLDARLKFAVESEHWAAKAHYQLITQFGDSLALGQQAFNLALLAGRVQNDDYRLFDLTHALSEADDHVILQRLDRAYAEHRQDQWVVRAGRQAVSWGNGLMYSPMDFFNPFDPAAVDREYKTGDDMLYGQYLRENGEDVQAVWVVRRDQDKNLDSDANTAAIKYHGFVDLAEYDLLLARHYSDTVVGVGGSLPWGGAVLRGDITATDTSDDTLWSLVASWSWSWVGLGKNMSAGVEYFYNGFGQDHEQYSPAELQTNPELLTRVLRGELYTLGKQYAAVSLLVELTPLLHVTPNVFVNLDDQSVLAQLVAQYDVAENWQLLLALNLPAGSSGSEYGGFPSGIDDLELGSGSSVFAQMAWYF